MAVIISQEHIAVVLVDSVSHVEVHNVYVYDRQFFFFFLLYFFEFFG